MFINCPYCRALIATDLATDLPPAVCPQCRGPLRAHAVATIDPSLSVPSAPASNVGIGNNSNATLAVDRNAAYVDLEITANDAATPETGGVPRSADADVVFIDPIKATDADAGRISETAINHPPEMAHSTQISTSNDTSHTAEIMAAEPMITDELTTDAIAADVIADHPLDADALHANTAETDAVILMVDSKAGNAGNIDHQGHNKNNTPAILSPERRARGKKRTAQTAPSFARERSAPTTTARHWPSIAVVVGLALLLSLQLLLADRARLAANTHWRPLLQTLCGALSCTLPPWREPGAFTLLQRDVRQHPNIAGALRVSATFRNDARWPQPWPQLELSLSDVNGRPAGKRIFQMREYLGGAPAQSQLGSGETASIAMDIFEPATQIVAYDFSFH